MGSGLMFVWLLTVMHSIEAAPEAAQAAAGDGVGGGYIGSLFERLLWFSLGGWGAIVAAHGVDAAGSHHDPGCDREGAVCLAEPVDGAAALHAGRNATPEAIFADVCGRHCTGERIHAAVCIFEGR